MPVHHRFYSGTREYAQVVILECGSKSTPLIAGVCRDAGVCTRTMAPADFEHYAAASIPKAVFVSGGPDSVYDFAALQIPYGLLMYLNHNHGTAIFGICYGAQALAHAAGGKVKKASFAEVGTHMLKMKHVIGGYLGGPVVMNHSDEIASLPFGWERWGSTERSAYALFGTDNILCTLFHPEMGDTQDGEKLIAHFLYSLARCRQDHTTGPEAFVADAIPFISDAAPEGGMVVGVSGGVDSAVTLELCRQVLGRERVYGIHVDNGFLCEGETEEVRRLLGEDGMIYEDAARLFWRTCERINWRNRHEKDYFSELRQKVGERFISVFEKRARRIGGIRYLGQGTNFSDIQETNTGLVRHHNVGGLPEEMQLEVVEPLAGLHKFEIREVAEYLGLGQEIVWRQPSPGPANSLRMWPPVTRAKASPVARANRILEEEVRRYYPDPRDRPSQYYAALISGRMAGIVGDKEVYGYAILVRAVKRNPRESYASAEPFSFPDDLWRTIDTRIRAEVVLQDGMPIVAVCWHGTGKPPARIECH